MLNPKMKVKKKWSKSGVSEVVGNILILAITVVLFSSIIVLVFEMPMPTETHSADFDAEINFIDTTSGYLNITHIGGEQLYNATIRILVEKSEVVSVYNLTDDADFTDTIPWKASNVWSKILTGITTSTRVTVRIIDVDANAIIWTGTVSGGTSTNSPVILQRWVDSDTTTATPDPIRESQTANFTLFVRVSDPDFDLNSSGVYVDASALPGGESQMSHTGTVTGGVWEFVFTDAIGQDNADDYDEKPLFIHAIDEAGHEVIDIYQLEVFQPDITLINEGADYWNVTGVEEELGEGGLPTWMLFQGGGHGYVILGENITARAEGGWGYKANTTDPQTAFILGEEWIFVRVGSTSLKNYYGMNQMTVINRLSGESVTPPTSSSAFSRIPYSGAAYLYQAKFNSSILPPGAYDVDIKLQSSISEGGTPTYVHILANLTILPEGDQEPVFAPTLKIFKDSSRDADDEWGTSSDPFDLSNVSTCVAWVELTMQDAGDASTLTVGEVRIQDFSGRSNLHGTPPTSTSNMLGEKQSDGLTKYYFSMDLRLKNGVSWLAGTSAYSLTVTNIFDANEGVYTISMPIWVRSPASMKNYVAGTNGLGVGHANFAHFSYLFQIDNNKFFTTRVIEERDESPGGGGGASMEVYDLIYFDMDEDGDRDILAAISDNLVGGHVLGIYINRLNEYGIWETRSNFDNYTDGNGVLSMAYGDIDLDGDLDWVVAGESTGKGNGGNVYLYINDFPIIERQLFADTDDGGHGFVEMRLADVTGDGKADLIALDCGVNVEYDATSTERGSINAELKIYEISTYTPIFLNILPAHDSVHDFDVADMDGDGDNDIALVTDSATYGVRWFKRTVTYGTAYADDEDTPAGTIAENSYTATFSGDNSYEKIQEVDGDLEHIWTIDSVSGEKPTVYIDAKVSDNADEGFYFYYSDNSGGPYTFMFTLAATATTETTYTFPLPLDTSGDIYLKVIDSSTSAGGSQDSIWVDRMIVTGIDTVSYAAISMTGDTTYNSISIGDFNSDTHLDVALGKSAAIKVINGLDNTILADSGFDDVSDISPDGDTFEVGDVNGDTIADIISVLSDGSNRAIIYEWINLGGGTTYQGIQVKNLAYFIGGDAGPSYTGDIRHLSVENPFGA